MKIAITGAAGNAGQAVVRLLSTTTHELTLGDMAPQPPGLRPTDRYLRCDTRSAADVDQLLAGADAVIHLAAWHCAHQPPVSDGTIFAVNVDGTFNVVQSCRRHKINAVVFASSMAFGLGGVYGATKVIGEDLFHCLHHMTKAAVVHLRYHEFLPCPYLRFGQKLLHNGVDRQDVAASTVAAVEAAAAGKVTDFMTVVHNHLGAPAEVVTDFGRQGLNWLESQLPGTGKLIEKYRIKLPDRLEQHDMSEAAKKMGWSPRVNFLSFLTDLQKRDAAGQDVSKLKTSGDLTSTV